MLLVMDRVRWTKSICRILLWGPIFLSLPALPEDRYLKLSSQKRSKGRNLIALKCAKNEKSGTQGDGGVCHRCPYHILKFSMIYF